MLLNGMPGMGDVLFVSYTWLGNRGQSNPDPLGVKLDAISCAWPSPLEALAESRATSELRVKHPGTSVRGVQTSAANIYTLNYHCAYFLENTHTDVSSCARHTTRHGHHRDS